MIQNYKTKRLQQANAATVNRELCCLRNMLSKAVEWGYLKSNPASGVRQSKEKPKVPRYLEKEEITALLAECPPYLYDIVITAVNTGLRRSELFNLEWSDIDFKRRIITIQNKTKWHTKNYEAPGDPHE